MKTVSYILMQEDVSIMPRSMASHSNESRNMSKFSEEYLVKNPSVREKSHRIAYTSTYSDFYDEWSEKNRHETVQRCDSSKESPGGCQKPPNKWRSGGSCSSSPSHGNGAIDKRKIAAWKTGKNDSRRNQTPSNSEGGGTEDENKIPATSAGERTTSPTKKFPKPPERAKSGYAA